MLMNLSLVFYWFLIYNSNDISNEMLISGGPVIIDKLNSPRDPLNFLYDTHVCGQVKVARVPKLQIVPMSSTDCLIDQESALSPASSRSTCLKNLISRVCDHGLSLRGQDRERREDEKIVSKLISCQIERQPIRDMEYCEPHGIDILPYDVIRKIINQLGDIYDLFSCQLGEKSSSFQDYRKLIVYTSVCRRWNATVQDIWLSKLLKKGKLFAILKKCPELRELHITAIYLEDNVIFFIIGNCCPKIEKLVFQRAEFEGASLGSLAKYCPGLKSLHLSNCRYLYEDNLEGFLRVAKGLEYLTLTNNCHITGKCFNHLPKIRRLDIRGCNKLTDESFTKLGEKCSCSLQQVKVGKISKSSLFIICESFPNLTVLIIDGFKIESGSPTLDRITSFQLEKLEYFGVNCPSYEVIDDREFLGMMKSARKLKKLLLLSCYWLTDEMLSTALAVCKEIKCLAVVSSQITDKSLISIAQLDSLVILSLSGTKVTDQGIMKLLTKCINLAYLDVDDCFSVSFATLYNAYDLISQGSLNKQLVIRFRGHIVRMKIVKARENISDYHPVEDYYESASSSDVF
ncbi:F-box and leucine-rich repeat protein 13-like [Brevipalpus obovatus]|uniref:F-box and leucine-rich repeat protein 13-like n=1 Tax=Brevipalpus obovatus TaxID=246614 RepID=UPI003D9E023D